MSRVTEVLEGRFGPLPAELRSRMLSADANALDIWLRRAIQALDLKSFFS